MTMRVIVTAAAGSPSAAAVQAELAAPPPLPHDVVNRVLQELGWFGQEGAAVPLQGGLADAGRLPTVQQLRLLSQHRRLLADSPDKTGVEGNLLLLLGGLFDVLRRAEGSLREGREKSRMTSSVLLLQSAAMESFVLRVLETHYAALILDEVLVGLQTGGKQLATAFQLNEEHAQLTIRCATQLHHFLRDDLLSRMNASGGRISGTDRQLRSFVRLLKVATGVLWYLLRPISVVAPVSVVRFLKTEAAAVTALGADLLRWFNVTASAAIQALVAGEASREFDNTIEVAASLLVEVACECRFIGPLFLLTSSGGDRAHPPASQLSSAEVLGDLLAACRSIHLTVSELCGGPGSNTASPPGFSAAREMAFTRQHQRALLAAVRERLMRRLSHFVETPGSEAGQDSRPATVFHLFALGALGPSPILTAAVGYAAAAPTDLDGKARLQGGGVSPTASITKLLSSPFADAPSPPRFFGVGVTTAFAMSSASAEAAWADDGSSTTGSATKIAAWRIFCRDFLQLELLQQQRTAEIVGLPAMARAHVLPLLAAAARSDPVAAHMQLDSLARVGTASFAVMRGVLGSGAPPKHLLRHFVDVWHTAVMLSASVRQNQSFGARDAAAIIALLADLFPAKHMHESLNTPKKGTQDAQRRAGEYVALRSLLRDTFAVCAAGGAAETKTSSPLCEVATNACAMVEVKHFGSRFAETHHVHCYVLAFGSVDAAKNLSIACVVNHVVPVALACLRCSLSPSLRLGGHDALIAPILAKHPTSPLIVPTYVSYFAPPAGGAQQRQQQQQQPPLDVLGAFSRFARAVCQAVEQTDDVRSALDSAALSPDDRAALAAHLSPDDVARVRGLGAALLIVQAIYDCARRFSSGASDRSVALVSKDVVHRRQLYVAALVNLTQCSDPRVLSRVCASIEALLTAKITNVAEQDMWVAYAFKVAQGSVNYSTKKELTSWVMALERKIRDSRVARIGEGATSAAATGALMSKL